MFGFGYLDFVYTKEGKFGMVLAFNKKLHKFKIVFDYGKPSQNTDYYFKEELKPIV